MRKRSQQSEGKAVKMASRRYFSRRKMAAVPKSTDSKQPKVINGIAGNTLFKRNQSFSISGVFMPIRIPSNRNPAKVMKAKNEHGEPEVVCSEVRLASPSTGLESESVFNGSI